MPGVVNKSRNIYFQTAYKYSVLHDPLELLVLVLVLQILLQLSIFVVIIIIIVIRLSHVISVKLINNTQVKNYSISQHSITKISKFFSMFGISVSHWGTEMKVYRRSTFRLS